MFGIDLNRFSKFCAGQTPSAAPYESRQTHRNLLEVVTQLDNRSTTEFSRLVHRQHTVLETVQLRLDQEQVTASRQPST